MCGAARLRTVACLIDIIGHNSAPRRVGSRYSKEVTTIRHDPCRLSLKPAPTVTDCRLSCWSFCPFWDPERKSLHGEVSSRALYLRTLTALQRPCSVRA